MRRVLAILENVLEIDPIRVVYNHTEETLKPKGAPIYYDQLESVPPRGQWLVGANQRVGSILMKSGYHTGLSGFTEESPIR